MIKACYKIFNVIYSREMEQVVWQNNQTLYQI